MPRSVKADPAAIAWEDPPKSRQGNRRPGWFDDFIEPLRKRPGQWARVLVTSDRKQADSRAGYVRKLAKERSLPIEAVARSSGDGQGGSIYARWTGK